MKQNYLPKENYAVCFIIITILGSAISEEIDSGCGNSSNYSSESRIESCNNMWKASSHSPSGESVIKVYTKGFGGRIECVYAEVGPEDLDTGTAINQAMKDHVRLQDANNISDQAGQIVVRKLGGKGNVTYNVFPQNGKRVPTLWTRRAQQIYDDLKNTSGKEEREPTYKLTYKFQYDNQSARPKRPTGWSWHILTPNGTVFFDKFLNPAS